MNLGFVGKKFTWENQQAGCWHIKERIDRVIASRDWVPLFDEAQVEHMFALELDHSPIMLSTVNEWKNGRRPFRFLNVWEEDQSSHAASLGREY